MEKMPKISIVLCVYNGERTLDEFFKALFAQDYPSEKIEILVVYGKSDDNTLDIIKNYQKKHSNIKIINNPKRFNMGKGAGLDIGTQKATGEFIAIIDQDNILVQKDWLKNMINIMVKNKEITGVQSRLTIPDGTIIDKYLNAIGIEDPFAIPYSLNAQIVLNPKKFYFDNELESYIYEVNKENFYYAGSNGFIIRKDKIKEIGGWYQDIDNFYKMASKNWKIATPKNIKLHHKTSTNLWHFLSKRSFYIKHYIVENYEGREFYWINFKKNSAMQNMKFIRTVVFNLIIIPGLIKGISMAIKEKKKFWLIHPAILFLITIDYIYSFLYSKIIGTKESKI